MFRRGRKYCTRQGWLGNPQNSQKENSQKQLACSWEVTDHGLMTREPAWGQRRTSAYVMALWHGLLVRFQAVGVGPVPNALTGSSEHIPHTGSPCPLLTQRVKLSPTSTYYAMLCWHPWEACSFLNRGGGRID